MIDSNKRRGSLPCCRSKFVLDQVLDYPESEVLEYKMFQLPACKQTLFRLRVAVCAFLNGQGGTVICGVKENSKKQHIVLGLLVHSPSQINSLIQGIKQGFNPTVSEKEVAVDMVRIDSAHSMRVLLMLRVSPSAKYLYGFTEADGKLGTHQFNLYKREWTESRKLNNCVEFYDELKRRASLRSIPELLHVCRVLLVKLEDQKESTVEPVSSRTSERLAARSSSFKFLK